MIDRFSTFIDLYGLTWVYSFIVSTVCMANQPAINKCHTLPTEVIDEYDGTDESQIYSDKTSCLAIGVHKPSVHSRFPFQIEDSISIGDKTLAIQLPRKSVTIFLLNEYIQLDH